MTEAERRRECFRLQDVLRRVEELLSTAQSRLGQLDDAVALAKGDLSAARSTLQRIADQIESNAVSTIGCGTGSGKDCVAVGIGLAREQARQQGKIERLHDKVRRFNAARDGARRLVEDRIRDLDRVASAIRDNRC